MKIGTRSVLYGAHCFFIHPWFVAWAWWKLYGFPWDPRLWVAFFVHDLGYFGKPNMDGDEGERHVEWGAKVMARLFDRAPYEMILRVQVPDGYWPIPLGGWGMLTLLHSRFYAKRYGYQPSRLCVADKLAIALEPSWFYLPRAWVTGELREYRSMAFKNHGGDPKASVWKWHRDVQDYCRKWAYRHQVDQTDTMTKHRHLYE